jgi:hypothetical protein
MTLIEQRQCFFLVVKRDRLYPVTPATLTDLPKFGIDFCQNYEALEYQFQQ